MSTSRENTKLGKEIYNEVCDEMEKSISKVVSDITENLFKDSRVKACNAMSYDVVRVIIENAVKEGFIAGVEYSMRKIG